MQNKDIVRPVLVTAALLLIPFIFDWPWSGSDYAIAGALLLLAGFAIEFLVRRGRWGIGLAVLAILAFIWAELAVGLIGTPFAGN